MNKKKFIIIGVLLFMIIFIFFVINLTRKISFNNYIENTVKYFKEINYNTDITLSIDNNDSLSKVQYSLKKTSSIVNEEYFQYVDDNLQNHINNYYITRSSGTKLYIKNGNSYKSENVQKVSTIFEIDYDDFKSKTSNIKYLGTKKINDRKNLKYSVKMKVYDIYNIIYNEDILTSKDNNNYNLVYIYIDKELGLISKIESSIDNLNNTSYNPNELKYKLDIVNTDFNNNKTINLPFNENN